MSDADRVAPEDVTEAQTEADVKAAVNLDDLAREWGWKPEDEWKGDKAKWSPADEFVRRRVSHTSNITKELKAVNERMDRLSRTTGKVLADALDKQRAQIEAEHAEAVENGDYKAVRAAESKMRKLEAEAEPPADSPDVAFKARNSWYGDGGDEEATDYAVARSQRYVQQGKTGDAMFKAVEADVRKKFPDLFDDTGDDDAPPPPAKKKQPPEVANPRRSAQPLARDKGVADLPPEARKAGEEYVRMIGTKMPGAKYTMADYAKSYWAENAA